MGGIPKSTEAEKGKRGFVENASRYMSHDKVPNYDLANNTSRISFLLTGHRRSASHYKIQGNKPKDLHCVQWRDEKDILFSEIKDTENILTQIFDSIVLQSNQMDVIWMFQEQNKIGWEKLWTGYVSLEWQKVISNGHYMIKAILDGTKYLKV